jgi:outer membrane protein
MTDKAQHWGFLALAMTALSFAGAVWADPFPLWEAGAGIAVVDFPDYRGSDERQTYLLPVPYVIYRGEILKIERQKIRGLLFSSDAAELDVSASGSVPVRSQDNSARQGMPDLDPTLELGPSLNIFLYRGVSEKLSFELRLPLRAVVATDFRGFDYEGWLFHPHLSIDLKDVIPGPGWNLGLLAGPLFGSQRYHEYFYGVAPQFATSDRPAFDADAGYSGTQFIAALSKRFQNYWFGAFVKADSLDGAAFEDSPLVKKKHAVAGGFAVAWVFAKSGVMVEAKE